ncbi:MAG: alpha-L-arabinofuranosidase [Bacteroidales bacterium]|nr:alpha-L-arabinofuranosidase [Bacteroidales bacterium]
MKSMLMNMPGMLMFLLMTLNVTGQKSQPVVVDVDRPKAEIQPTMWGIFFEDINQAADGGIYAELVMNRSFEFFNPRAGWGVKAFSKDSSALVILNRGISNQANPRFARISVTAEMPSYCLSNKGFRGMGVKAGNRYHFSMLASLPESGSMKLRIELVDAGGKPIGESSITLQGNEWKKYSTELTSGKTDAHARLNIWFEDQGVADIDMVSLFPHDTWKNRPGGLRADLVQLLADLKPGFLRFPGGCIVEGRELDTRYKWKKTVGPVEERQLIVNRWNTEFKHRPSPDYFQSFGLGFYEYFLLSEDIGAEPLPILNCGMACQFNTAEVVPVDQLDPYIQDALDLIEFANGSPDTKWGKIRADMGHPEPFGMKLLGIGNEQWGPQYFERLEKFEKVLREKHPEITLILSAGPFAEGDLFDFAWTKLEQYAPQVVDEHYYKEPAWFFKNASRYDSYKRDGHKIFAGEYAAQSVNTTSPDNQNNWECALSEAAFMTGLERNADVVTMCSYAPLLAHTEGWQWTPDLIWFDNLKSFGTANYYVQKLFSNYKGTDVLSMLYENKPLTGKDGLYGSAVWDRNTSEIILKVVNATTKPLMPEIVLKSRKKLPADATMIVLKSDKLTNLNSIDQPLLIQPSEVAIKLNGKKLNLSFAPHSLTIIRIKQN